MERLRGETKDEMLAANDGAWSCRVMASETDKRVDRCEIKLFYLGNNPFAYIISGGFSFGIMGIYDLIFGGFW